MRKTIYFLTLFFGALPTVQAANLLDWLDQAKQGKAEQRVTADAARLVTLEEQQNEMYPKPGPDGRFLLDISAKGKSMWVSRRYSENGDPANRVTSDPHALDSISWRSDGKVLFLSERAGSLGLWEKISDGEGMLRRVAALNGMLTQPIMLPDESIVAVRLVSQRTQQGKTKHQDKDVFNNWEFDGYRSEIVRFGRDGSEWMLIAEGVNPALSPDGEWIAFAMPTGRSMHLYRMRIDGSELIQMTDARSVDVQPAWSVDGKSLLFTSNRADADMRHPSKSAWDIWAIGIDGRGLTQITYDAGRDGAARIDAKGRIYFHSDRKIDKAELATRQVKSAGRHGFHIWRIAMPAAPVQH